VRSRAASAWKYVEDRVHLTWFRVPHLVLFAGSVLVLLTLYLPTVTVSSWSTAQPGLEIVSGSSDAAWPSFTGFLDSDSRWGIVWAFYLFYLAVAAFSVLFLAASVLRRDIIRKRSLLVGLLGISGLAALFSAADLFVLIAMIKLIPVLSDDGGIGWKVLVPLLFLFPVACLRPEFRTKKGVITGVFILAGIVSALFWLEDMAVLFLLGILPVACFRPEFWTKKGAAAWGFILAAIISAPWFGDRFLSRVYPRWVGSDRFWTLFLLLIGCLFLLLPLVLWFRYRLFGNGPSRLWPDVGRRLAIFYAGTVVVDLFTVAGSSYWGLSVFFLGVCLIFFGYWRLKREAGRDLRVSPPYPGAAASSS
jgi:hypothetical protein